MEKENKKHIKQHHDHCPPLALPLDDGGAASETRDPVAPSGAPSDPARAGAAPPSPRDSSACSDNLSNAAAASAA